MKLHPILILTLLLPLPLLAKPKPAPTPTPAVQNHGPKPDPRWPFQPAPPPEQKPVTPETGGLGIVLGEKNGDIFVNQVIPGGPAQRAGLRAGDVLVSTDTLPQARGQPMNTVTQQIRGLPGTVCKMTVRRGTEDRKFEVTRVSMKRLFPPPAKEVLTVQPGRALLAVGAQHALAVTWLATQKGLITAQVTTSSAERPFVQVQEKMVEVALPADATVLQVEDWKLDLRRVPETETLAVVGSNLPVHEMTPDRQTWLDNWPDPVAPRALPKLTQKWRGPVAVKLRAMAAGKPVANHRITLRISQNGKELETVTQVTDAEGHFTVQLGEGPFHVRGLSLSTPGGKRDAAFPYQLSREVELLASTQEIAQTLTLDPHAAQTGNIDDWKTEEHVGQGLPVLLVQKWLGEKFNEPKDLHGQVLLIYLWATWCGPCRMTAPVIAELNVRMEGKPIKIVEASVDRDEQALEQFHKDFLPGAPSVAWVGPDALETLELSSIPTFIVVDQHGVIRGMRRGGGWSLEALETWLNQLIEETKHSEETKHG